MDITQQIKIVLDEANVTSDLKELKLLLENLIQLGGQFSDKTSSEFKEVDSAIVTLETKIKSIKDELSKSLDVEVNIDDAPIEDLNQELSQISDKEVDITTNVDDSEIQNLNQELDSIDDKTVEVNTEVDDTQVKELSDEIDSLEDKTIEITTQVDDSSVKDLNQELDDLNDKEVKVDVTANADSLSSLNQELSGLNDQKVEVDVEADSQSLDSFKKGLDNLKVEASEPIKLDVKDAGSKAVFMDLIKSVGNTKAQLDILNKTQVKPTVDTKDVDKGVKSIEDKIDNIPTIDIVPEVDSKAAEKGIEDIKSEVEDVTSLDYRLKVAIDNSETVSSVTDIRKSLKELTSLAIEAGDTNSAAFQKAQMAAGKLQDKVNDVKDGIRTFSGDPIENLSRGFGTLKNKITDLDFEGFTQEVNRLKDVSKGVTFDSLSKSVQGTGAAFANLGKILLTNPIFLIATVIAGIVVALTQLDKAEQARTDASIERQTKIENALNREYDARIKLINTVKGLSQAEIEALDARVKKYGSVKDKLAETDVYNIRKNQLKDEIDSQNAKTEKVLELNTKEKESLDALTKNYKNGIRNLSEEGEKVLNELRDKRIESLETLGGSISDSQKKELDRLIEYRDKTIANRNEIVQNSAEKAKEISSIDKNSIKEREDATVAAIKNDSERSKKQLELNQKRELQANQETLDRLKELHKEESQEYKNAEAARAEIIKKQGTETKELQIAQGKEAATKAVEIQKEASDAAIARTKEGSKERVDAETKAIDDMLALQIKLKNGLELSENEIVVLKKKAADDKLKIEQDYYKQLEELAIQYAKTSSELAISTAQVQVDSAKKNSQEQVDAQNKLIEAQRDAALQSIDIEAKKQIELKKLRIDSLPEGSDERKKAEQELADFEANIANQRLITAKSFNDQIQKNNEDFVQKQKDIQRFIEENDTFASQAEARKAANKLYLDDIAKRFDDELKLVEAGSEQEKKINEEKNAALAAANQQFNEQELAARTEQYAAYADQALGLAQTLADIGNEQRQAELDDLEDKTNQQLSTLDKQEKQELSQKNLTEKQKIDIQNKYEKQKYELQVKLVAARNKVAEKEFNTNKAFQLANAVLDGARAVTNALANGGPPPANFIQAGIAGALALAQIIKISQTQFKPEGSPPAPDLQVPSGDGGAGGGGDNAPTFQAPQFFNIGQQQQNNQQSQQPQQVYVLETDITRVQNKVQVIEDRAIYR